MDFSNSSLFPSLPSSSSPSRSGGAPARGSFAGKNWSDIFRGQVDSSKESSLSYIVSEGDKVDLSDADVQESQKDWELSLVGYAIGKRPFYGALLAAIKRKWKFTGSMELHTMAEDFFLFKFTCAEDLNMVFDGGPCFLNGRPFIFRKWTWDFRPEKEEFAEIPLWIKLPNFPLIFWNDTVFSKVASKVGVPIALDGLTAKKQRISFARICVLIKPTSPLPNSISLSLKGRDFEQPIVYDWKPSSCIHCNTFTHDATTCPKNTAKLPTQRGRSRSRAPPRPQARPNPPITGSIIPHPTAPIEPLLTTPITDLNQPPISSPPYEPTVAESHEIPNPETSVQFPVITAEASLSWADQIDEQAAPSSPSQSLSQQPIIEVTKLVTPGKTSYSLRSEDKVPSPAPKEQTKNNKNKKKNKGGGNSNSDPTPPVP